MAQCAVGEDVDGRVALGHHEGDVHDTNVTMPVEVGAVKDRGRQPAAHEQTPHDGQLLQQRHRRAAFRSLRIRRRHYRSLRRRDGLLREFLSVLLHCLIGRGTGHLQSGSSVKYNLDWSVPSASNSAFFTIDNN